MRAAGSASRVPPYSLKSRGEIALFIGQIAGLAAIYFLTGKLGLQLAFVHRSATAVWPPTGIAIAALLLLGRRLWPGPLAGGVSGQHHHHAVPRGDDRHRHRKHSRTAARRLFGGALCEGPARL